MGNQFNFYQTDHVFSHWITGDGINTGYAQIPSIFPISWVTGEDGGQFLKTPLLDFLPINPLASFFSGVYRPATIQLGGVEGFLWTIYNDGERFPYKYRIKLSGELASSNSHFSNFLVEYSGEIRFSLSDSGQYQITYSGDIYSGRNDIPLFENILSGEIQSGIWTRTEISGILSGDCRWHPKDTSDFESFISGELSAGINQKSLNFEPIISGSVEKKNKDILNINLYLSGVTFVIGGRYLTIISGDSMDINFNLNQVFYRIGV